MPTVLDVRDPHCGWRRLDQANVRALSRATKSRYQLTAVSLSRLQADDSSWLQEMGGRVFHQPTEATKRAYGLGGVPWTIVIAPTGTVEKLRRGAYVDEVRREVEDDFGIRLPGIE
jgi:hypothetical protein